MSHLKRSSTTLSLIRSKHGMDLVIRLQIMQQLTTLVIFFKSEEYRASLIFYYSSVVFIIIVINCQAAFKLNHQIL